MEGGGGREREVRDVLVLALGVGRLGRELVDALADAVELLGLCLLGLEARLDRRELVVDLCDGLLALLDLGLGHLVLLVARELALERVQLDLELELCALEPVDVLGRRLARDAHGRARLVDAVDGRVGEAARGEVAVGERGGGDERRVEDGDAVVNLRGEQRVSFGVPSRERA